MVFIVPISKLTLFHGLIRQGNTILWNGAYSAAEKKLGKWLVISSAVSSSKRWKSFFYKERIEQATSRKYIVKTSMNITNNIRV